MASDPDKQTLPCLGCLRIMSTTVYQSNDPPRKCIFGPGSDTCVPCLKMQSSAFEIDCSIEDFYRLQRNLLYVLSSHENAQAGGYKTRVENDHVEKTRIQKANIKERLTGFYKAVEAFKQLHIDDDVYMEPSKAYDAFKAGAESIVELIEMADEETNGEEGSTGKGV